MREGFAEYLTFRVAQGLLDVSIMGSHYTSSQGPIHFILVLGQIVTGFQYGIKLEEIRAYCDAHNDQQRGPQTAVCSNRGRAWQTPLLN